ncbi:MAG: 50S ribosomal protein L15 [Acidimicrobiales bacterium]
MLHTQDLKPAAGSKKARKRVGRGIGGKGGKTAGRGTKGQGARDTIPIGFEGGQLPMAQRLPKLKGFNNPFRVSFSIVNVDAIEMLANEGVVVIDPEVLYAHGLVHKGELVKILANGELSKAVTVSAHAFSQSAAEKIRARGGSAVVVDRPNGGRRIPPLGNALMNR